MAASLSRLGCVLSQAYYTAWYGVLKREHFRPTYAIETFNELVVPPNIKLVIMDKDNCFAKPHATSVWPAFEARWRELCSGRGGYEVCVLSNTAGDAVEDPRGELAQQLEAQTGVRVLRHREKKPMCYKELAQSLPCRPEEVLVVGDRLVTDVLMANLIGAQSVWVRPGVHPSRLNLLEMWAAGVKGKSN